MLELSRREIWISHMNERQTGWKSIYNILTFHHWDEKGRLLEEGHSNINAETHVNRLD